MQPIFLFAIKKFLLNFIPKENYHLFRASSIYDFTPIGYAMDNSKSLENLKPIGELE